MVIRKFSLGLIFLSHSLFSGVHVLVDLPQGINEVIQKAQSTTEKAIDDINEEKKTTYIFSKSLYKPHISLAFVSAEKGLSNEEIKTKFPALVPLLKKVAGQHAPIDFTENIKSPTVTFWKGRYEMECGGSKKKNYYNLVLQLATSSQLNKLAEDVEKGLESEYGIIQGFPFGAHLTLGRICEANDQPIATDNIQFLKQYLTKAIGSGIYEMPIELTISKFMLKGDDEASDKDFEYILQGKEDK